MQIGPLGRTETGRRQRAEQATFLLQAYHCLAQDPYVQVGIWYGLQETELNGFGGYGLFDQNLNPKPSYHALQEYSRHGDQLTESCSGNTNGPPVRLIRPKTGVRYSSNLPIAVSASGKSPVWDITLYEDGHLIRNFYVHDGLPTLTGSMIWSGARKLKPGRHNLTEPAMEFNPHTRLAGECLQPLGHLSRVGQPV